jgi:hypothetical protein
VASPSRSAKVFARSIVQSILRGAGQDESFREFNKRFGPGISADFDQYYGMAQTMVFEGLNLQAQVNDQLQQGKDISGTIPEGVSEVVVEVTIDTPDGGTKYRMLKIPVNSNTTINDLIDEIQRSIDEWIDTSGDVSDETSFQIMYMF